MEVQPTYTVSPFVDQCFTFNISQVLCILLQIYEQSAQPGSRHYTRWPLISGGRWTAGRLGGNDEYGVSVHKLQTEQYNYSAFRLCMGW